MPRNNVNIVKKYIAKANLNCIQLRKGCKCGAPLLIIRALSEYYAALLT